MSAEAARHRIQPDSVESALAEATLATDDRLDRARLMATGDHENPEDARLERDRSLALVLAGAGAFIFAGSLAPWPLIDILHPFSQDATDPVWLERGYLTFAAGVGIIVIASRIALEVGRHRQPWAAAGLSMILMGVGLIVAWLSLDLLGLSTFQGLTPFPLAFFAGLALIGSRIPMNATARRPRSVALVLAVVALGDFLILFVTYLLADPEWGPSLAGHEVGLTVAALGALVATVIAWSLRMSATAHGRVGH